MANDAMVYWKIIITTMLKAGKEKKEIVGSLAKIERIFTDLKNEKGTLTRGVFLKQLVDETERELKQ